MAKPEVHGQIITRAQDKRQGQGQEEIVITRTLKV